MLQIAFYKRYSFLFIIYLSTIAINGQTIYPNFWDGKMYVKLRDTCSNDFLSLTTTDIQLGQTCSYFGVNFSSITQPFPDQNLSIPLSKVYHIEFTNISEVDSLVYYLELNPSIEYAEKIPIDQTTLVPNDIHPFQYHLTKINAFGAWDISQGNSSVVIAIVDNAVRITHSDLMDNIWINPGEIPGNFLDDDLNGYTDDVNGYDVADMDNNPNPPLTVTDADPFVHGTHCAGISSAVSNNNNGISSLGFNSSIMAVKCTPDSETGNALTNAYDGVYYALRSNADIISMSWGSSGSSITNEYIINLANSLGIVLVAAAGNEDTSSFFYPAAFNNVIGVGSTDQNDFKSGFSNYGSYIDVMAPGSGIYSTLAGTDDSYGTLSGTSMACPLVAGLAALVLDVHPSYTPLEVELAIENGCDNIDLLNPGYTGMLGSGRINAYKTLNIVGLSEKPEQIPFTVFPNPTVDQIEIRLDESTIYDGSLVLVDLYGNRILERRIGDGNSIRMDLSNLSSGLYIIELISQDYFSQARIIKQ